MKETVSTIYYKGSFWKALIERIGEDGNRSLAESKRVKNIARKLLRKNLRKEGINPVFIL